MRASIAARLGRVPAGAGFLLLVCALSAPSTVQAGCSHYVTSRAIRELLSRQLDPLIQGETGLSRVEPTPGTDPPRPRPCTGPSCSGDPAPPAVPSPAQARYVELWACLGADREQPRLGSAFLPTHPTTLRPSTATLGIFHPPRGDTGRPV